MSKYCELTIKDGMVKELKQTQVYIKTEEIMKLKAQLILSDVFTMFRAEKQSVEELDKLRLAFIACLEGVDLKEFSYP